MIKLQHSALIIFSLWMSGPVFSQDKFADIGVHQYDNRTQLLVVPQPPVLTDISLNVNHDPSAVFKPFKYISTKEELYAELDKMRKQYEPFMRNLAPDIASSRHQIPLSEFNWREETLNDITNFTATLTGEGKWENVKIPHFGPPLGRAVTYYFKEVDLAKEDFSKGTLFMCFKGVDYRASVFLNGRYCGFHEGFFAPFEFEISKIAKIGHNNIFIKVENDYPTTTTEDNRKNSVQGEKIRGSLSCI